MTIKKSGELFKVEHISYTMGTCALPDIYTLALRPAALEQVRIHQAKHSCPWLTITYTHTVIPGATRVEHIFV